MCCECKRKNSRKDMCMPVCVQQILTVMQHHEYLAKEGSGISTSFHMLQQSNQQDQLFVAQ